MEQPQESHTVYPDLVVRSVIDAANCLRDSSRDDGLQFTAALVRLDSALFFATGEPSDLCQAWHDAEAHYRK